MLAGALMPMAGIGRSDVRGKIDWVQWRGTCARQASISDIGLTLVGRGASALPSNEPETLRWNDGTPVPAGSANEAVSFPVPGGIPVTVPADTLLEAHVVRGATMLTADRRAPLGQLGVGVGQRCHTERARIGAASTR